jgi:hypothetical protein
MTVLLRFKNLQQRGIVKNWPQFKRSQELYGFPLGRMLSPNIRAWTEEEIDAWIESRPIENTRPLQGAPKAKAAARKAAHSESGA